MCFKPMLKLLCTRFEFNYQNIIDRFKQGNSIWIWLNDTYAFHSDRVRVGTIYNVRRVPLIVAKLWDQTTWSVLEK